MSYNARIFPQYSDDTATSIRKLSMAHAMRDDVGAFVPGKVASWGATGSGILDGLSCGVKDVFDIAGCSTGYGNPEWQEAHALPTVDALVVAKLRLEGAHIVGKTVTDELGFSLVGNNFHFGAPTNSAAPDRHTGGSSCGSAAAVAAGLCDIGLGTDTAGSIRAPASFCGIFGIRPTHGMVAPDGVRRLAPSFDTIGWMTRNARTLAAVGAALLPDTLPSEEIKSWISFDSAWAILPEASQEAAASILNELNPYFGVRGSLAVEPSQFDEFVAILRTLQLYEVWREFGPWIEHSRPSLGPDIHEGLLLASNVSQKEYLEACNVRAHIRGRFRTLLKGGQIIVMPTTSAPGPLRGSTMAELNSRREADLRLLSIASLAGLPQISIPLLSENCAPLGISIIGPAGFDKSLLKMAEKLEGLGALKHPH